MVIVMAETPKVQDEYTEEETVWRRDAVLKRMLETPPQPCPKRERKPKRKSKEKPLAK